MNKYDDLQGRHYTLFPRECIALNPGVLLESPSTVAALCPRLRKV